MNGPDDDRRGLTVPHPFDEATAEHLQTLFDVGVVAALSDRELLERFTHRRGQAAETAFAVLLERHGSMVLRVCRGIVSNEHDAQDAFQATFFILARKGDGLWVRDSLGPWLHRVACRAASRIKAATNRQRAILRRAAEVAAGQTEPEARDDWGWLVHEEVDRLPQYYRLPVVLCDLEGQSYETASRSLGCPIGTVKSRLCAAGSDCAAAWCAEASIVQPRRPSCRFCSKSQSLQFCRNPQSKA